MRRIAIQASAGLLAGFLAVAAPVPAAAQSSHWGITAAFVPRWDPVPELYQFLYDVDHVDGDGLEFRVGLARGRDLGGDWSVSFVRNRIRAGTQFDELAPFFGTDGPLAGTYYVADDLRIDGIKFDGFVPFVTLKDRVQIGFAWGAGVGWLRGTVTEHEITGDVTFPPPAFEPTLAGLVETTRTVNVADEIEYTTLPLGNAEVAAAFLVAPGVKIRVAGGFSFPNTQVISITGNYLFGAR